MQAVLETPRIVRVKRRDDARNGDSPALENGDRLSQPEFHRRYLAHPANEKAELIEGVVYMSSPVRAIHGGPHARLMAWLGLYQANTPGTDYYDNVTFLFDFDNEVQPDACLLISPERGGRVQPTPDGYFTGAPELIVEVAASSAAYDLHTKRHVYRRHGVQEYLVALTHEREFRWFHWVDGEYVLIAPDQQGIYQSQFFPGLWLESSKFWAGDMAAVLAILNAGFATPEHNAFVAQLA